MRISWPLGGAVIALLAVGVLAPAPAAAGPEPVPADTQVTFSFGLKRDDAGAIAALRQVSDLSSPQYRQFPSREEIPEKYGASPDVVKEISALFTKYGLQPGLDPSGVFLSVTGTAEQWQPMLGARIVQQKIPLQNAGQAWARSTANSGKTGPGARALLRLNREVPDFVMVDAAYEYDTLQLSGHVARRVRHLAHREAAQRGDAPTLSGGGAEYVGDLMFGYNQLRTGYGVDALAADVGSSVRMVVMSTGTGYSDASLAVSQQCYSLPDLTFTRVATPGLTGPLPEGGQGDLDVQTVQSVLRAGSQVTVLEYTNAQLSFLHWSELFGLPEQPDVATKSSAECERGIQQAPPSVLAIEESVLLRAGGTVRHHRVQ